MSDVKLDSIEDFINLAKCLPEEGRKDVLSVLICFYDGDITAKEATELVGTIFEKYELMH